SDENTVRDIRPQRFLDPVENLQHHAWAALKAVLDLNEPVTGSILRLVDDQQRSEPLAIRVPAQIRDAPDTFAHDAALNEVIQPRAHEGVRQRLFENVLAIRGDGRRKSEHRVDLELLHVLDKRAAMFVIDNDGEFTVEVQKPHDLMLRLVLLTRMTGD